MKNISKILLAFVLGILVSFTLNVAAQVVLSSDAVSYSNSRTSETTVDGALDELFSAIEISQQIGDMTKIASIGDGTITGAISTLNTNLGSVDNRVSEMNTVIDNLSTQKSTAFTTDVAGTLSIYTKTVSIPKGTYKVSIFGNIYSSGGHAAQLYLAIPGLQLAGSVTNNTSETPVFSENIVVIEEDKVDVSLYLAIKGTGTSTCTLPSYSTYGFSLIRLK